jgi:hypothetical protein
MTDHDGWHPDDECSLDLLVDGELDSGRRRELLRRLDEHPEGWRRCALAFLEAQAWREELACPAPAPALNGYAPWAPRLARSERPLRLGPSWPAPARWGSLAAALLLAFALGRGTRESPNRSTMAPMEPPRIATPARVVAETPSPTPISLPSPEPRPDASWLDQTPDPLPEPIKSRVERQGYEVAQRRRLVSGRLKDGRRVLVPVEETQFRFVANRTL